MLKTIDDYIAQLDKVFPTPKVEREDYKTLVQGDWKLTLRTKLDENGLHPQLPVQVIANVSYKGHNASSWGCEDNESNAKLVGWFARRKNEAVRRRMDAERAVEKEGHELFWLG